MKVPRTSLIELTEGGWSNILVDNPGLGHIFSTRGSYPVYRSYHEVNRSRIPS